MLALMLLSQSGEKQFFHSVGRILVNNARLYHLKALTSQVAPPARNTRTLLFFQANKRSADHNPRLHKYLLSSTRRSTQVSKPNTHMWA